MVEDEKRDPLADLQINEYQIEGGGFGSSTDVTLRRMRQRSGPDLWAIYRSGNIVLGKDSEWGFEPMPSSRDDEYLAHNRFATPQEALALYYASKEGQTA